jgi:tetratricopeptide (TPR) repeat protein
MDAVDTLDPWRRLESSLHNPGDPRWAEEARFSHSVAARLRRAFALLRHGVRKVDAFLEAYVLACHCLTIPQSPRQRLQVFHALGLAYLGLGELAQALTTVEIAVDLAEHLPDLPACAELAYLAGSLARAQTEYPLGADHLAYAAELLVKLSDDDDPADTALMIDVLIMHATCLYALQAYDAAWAAIDWARLLVSRPPGDSLRAAAIAWVAAILLRWTGDSARGLQQALAASEVYAEQGTSPSHQMALGRVQTIVAECALDHAAAGSTGLVGFARDAYLRIAGPAVRRATLLACETGDTPGGGTALLARVRAERLRGRQTDRLATIASVLKRASKLGEPDLAIQAYTTRGDEFAARQESGSALASYQLADELSIRYTVPVLGFFARRALAHASEDR